MVLGLLILSLINSVDIQYDFLLKSWFLLNLFNSLGLDSFDPISPIIFLLAVLVLVCSITFFLFIPTTGVETVLYVLWFYRNGGCLVLVYSQNYISMLKEFVQPGIQGIVPTYYLGSIRFGG